MAETFALMVRVSVVMLMRLPVPVVVIAPLTDTEPPRRTTSPAICLAALILMFDELEAVPTSKRDVELEIAKLLPISIELLNEELAGTMRMEPDELKLKNPAEFANIVSSSNSAPPPAELL